MTSNVQSSPNLLSTQANNSSVLVRRASDTALSSASIVKNRRKPRFNLSKSVTTSLNHKPVIETRCVYICALKITDKQTTPKSQKATAPERHCPNQAISVDTELSQVSVISKNDNDSLERKNSDDHSTQKKEIVSCRYCFFFVLIHVFLVLERLFFLTHFKYVVPFYFKKPKDNPAPVLPKLGDAKVSSVLYGIKPNIFFKKKQNLVGLMNEQRIIACFQNDPKWKNDPNPLENPKYWQLFFALNLKFKFYIVAACGFISVCYLFYLSKLYKNKKKLFAVESRIKLEKKKKTEKSKEDNSNVLVESQLPLQTAETIFHFYLLCSIVRTALIGFYTGHLFQLTDALLVDLLLFLSYLWYQFEYLKHRVT
ncbi:hypothetical protein RFI_30317, partial [Reticulomyxa filosa]